MAARTPARPGLLRKRLYRDSEGAGRSRDGVVVGYVADVLRSGIVPADLRAALYTVLTTGPGVEVTAAEADLVGRTGVALGRLETVDGGAAGDRHRPGYRWTIPPHRAGGRHQRATCRGDG